MTLLFSRIKICVLYCTVKRTISNKHKMSFIGGSGKPSDYAETTVMPYYATYQEKETSIPSRRWMSVDTPAGPTTYAAGNVIRINLPGTAYLDPKNSFLKYTMKVTNSLQPAVATSSNVAVYRINEDLLRSYHWAAHKHFKRARLLSSSGVVLEDLDLYNVHECINRKFRGNSDQERTTQDCLSHTDMDDAGLYPTTGIVTGDYNPHMADFINATGFGMQSTAITPSSIALGTAAADGVTQVVLERNNTVSILGNATTNLFPTSGQESTNIKGLDYVYQLGFGLFKSGKLLPMQYMGGLVVELTVEDDNILCRQDSIRLANATANIGINPWDTAKISLSSIEFHSSLLRFDEKYDLGIAEALQQTGLRIPFNSYSVIRNVMRPQGQYTLTVSERASSVQAVYGVFRPVSAVNNAVRKMDGLEFWPRLDISDYQLHTATQNYPDNPVRLGQSATEAFAETIKCFQGLDRTWERSLSSGNQGCHDLINSSTYGQLDPRVTFTNYTAANFALEAAVPGNVAQLPNLKYPYAVYGGTNATGLFANRGIATTGEVPGFLQSGGQGYQFVFGINTSVHPDVSSGVNTAAMAMNMDLKFSFNQRAYLTNTNVSNANFGIGTGLANGAGAAAGNITVETDFELDVFVETERTLEILCGGSPRVIL
jgi:hypothetical protein